MRGEQPQTSLVGSPILIGAVTTLIAVIGVFLSYNANQGLPFVPTYDVTVKLPDAAGLVKGNEVRVGGKRVGVIDRISAREERAGPIAVVELKLEKKVEPLRDDSLITVRPRSPLGLKYIELIRGKRGRPLPQGGDLPLSAAQTIVELDQVVNALDAPTRRHLAAGITGLGTGLTGRGINFNAALAESPELLAHLERVMAALADPETNLGRTVRAASRVASELDAVAPELGSLVRGARTTARALTSVRGELAEILSELPPTEAVGIRTLRVARPVLRDARLLVRDVAPGIRVLPFAARRLDSAFDRGIPVLRRAAALSDRLQATLTAVERLASDPQVRGALERALATIGAGEATVRLVHPLQVDCNYVGLFARNAPGVLEEGDPSGTWFRTLPINKPNEVEPRADPAPDLHVNPYAFTGQNGECEAGNEPWSEGQHIGHVRGDQGDTEATEPPPGVRAP
jgi:virulence factor Mce-like protein